MTDQMEKKMSETVVETDIYESLSQERKRLQKEGLVPKWYTTGGYQMFKGKYDTPENTRSVRGRFEQIAAAAAKHLKGTKWEGEAEARFFEMMWEGWVSLSTPVLANMGTDRALPVSCSGGVIDDSIYGFYNNRLETAVLTKNGFGTSAYIGNIRPRGSKIRTGGKASGVVPVFCGHVQDMREVSQGSSRRGSWAGYIELDHPDVDELIDHIMAEPDDCNVGWNITDDFIRRLDEGDKEAIRRFQRAMKLKMVAGRGYFYFVDKVARQQPPMYEKHGLRSKASNLCSEITLHADDDHTYTCVLSSMNLVHFDTWKEKGTAYWATIFLDCVAEEFIQRAKTIKSLEKAVRSTVKGRALGLGQAGLHTMLQQKMIAFESFEAQLLSTSIAKHIKEEAVRASKEMAVELGEPEWCKGYGVRNTHLLAIAPTKSTALLMGGISEGINPDPAMVYTQKSAAGSIERINPTLLKIMKERGVYTKKVVREIGERFGSVQHVDWLSEDEKKVFKTAFEINQMTVVKLASLRQRFVDQSQSLNLFFAADEDPAWIAKVHAEAFHDPYIKSLYYIYTQAGVMASKEVVCEACQ